MQEQMLEQVDRQRITELARNVADIVSITGDEKEIAEYLGSEFEKLGMQVEYQEVEEGQRELQNAELEMRQRNQDQGQRQRQRGANPGPAQHGQQETVDEDPRQYRQRNREWPVFGGEQHRQRGEMHGHGQTGERIEAHAARFRGGALLHSRFRNRGHGGVL